ncbi:RAD9 [Candida metapsilosis]|uniref:RAD9 n=1 Tax=Candida metapsilosis TaxID=273372 RepID=A0A8H8DA25_9ASCO|nr:RAD9 [Candida metapsilosis]
MSHNTRSKTYQSVHIPNGEDSYETNTSLLANDDSIENTSPAQQSQPGEINSNKNYSFEETYVDEEDEEDDEEEEHRQYYEDQQSSTQILGSRRSRNNYSQDTQAINDDDNEVISMDIEGNSTQKSKSNHSDANGAEQLHTQDSDELPTQLKFNVLADTQLISREEESAPRGEETLHRLSDLKDTQVISNGPRESLSQLADTQPINIPTRQQLDRSKSRYDDLGETQVIIRRRHQNLPDTQVISHDTQQLNFEDSESQTANNRSLPYKALADTQVITKLNTISSQEDSIAEENPFIDLTSQAHQVEPNYHDQVSHRQVIHTQDEPETSLSLSKPNTLEIQTDDERDSSHVKEEEEEEEGSKDAAILDDLKEEIDSRSNQQKRRLPHSPFKIKRSKTANIGSYGDDYGGHHHQQQHHYSASTPGDRTQLRNYSEPLVFASPFEKTFLASSSSPSKKIADQSVRTDEDQTQADRTTEEQADVRIEVGEGEEEMESRSESRSQLDDISIRHISPPSSPDGINSLSLSESEEEEDNNIDADYTTEDINEDVSIAEKTASDERRIVPRRRVNNIVESQTPSCENNLPQEDDEYTIDGILRKEKSDTIYEEDIVSPDSVWATYNLKMYSGYINARYSDYVIVDFEQDSSRIKNEDLNPLDIRIGDTLNVKGKRFKCIVTGLSTGEPVNGIRCIRGYNLVHVKKNSKSRKVSEDNEFVFAVSQCSMELGDWVVHQQKFQIKQRGENDVQVGVCVGSEIFPTPNIPMCPATTTNGINLTYPSTPSKLSRHSTMSSRPLSPSPKKGIVQTSQLFANRLFCITNIEGSRKQTIKNLIETNGGIYLDFNLMDIFQYMSRTLDAGGGLYFNSSYSITSELKFVALLSSNYCRSSKYLQALALGWPILSDVYIDDVISGVIELEQWPAYCLPAGHSSKLNTVANCDLFQFRRNYELGQSLDFQMNLNNSLLRNYNVVIASPSVNESHKKSMIEMDTCKFIFHAFGAKSLNYAEFPNEGEDYEDGEFFNLVKTLHSQDNGDILICDYGNNQIAKLLYSFIDQANSASEKPARRHRSRLKRLHDCIELKIVDWEWVVQCVISGHIWQPTVTIKING